MPVSEQQPPMLGDFDGNRRNNFTALRILFAWLVLYGHSFPITAKGVTDPLKSVFGGSIWIGALAVAGFFAISGFLVTASFQRRGFLDYVISRVLRIYPALIVCVLLMVFVLGPVATTLEMSGYFNDPQTFKYLRNASAFFPMEFRLPGVFADNARPSVNGSLWTLTLEVSCYLLLVAFGVLGLLRSQFLINLSVICVLLFAMSFFTEIPLVGRRANWWGPALYFLIGVALYANRHSIPLSLPLGIAAALLCYASFGDKWFAFVFPPAFVYLIFYLAYCTPYLGVDERLGDPSYGIYIYAWPVQQLVTMWFPEEGPYFNTAVATAIVVLLAVLSWRLIEKPALGLKRRFLKPASSQ
ncbi:MAG: acyltransferase [Congregibacter sp.]